MAWSVRANGWPRPLRRFVSMALALVLMSALVSCSSSGASGEVGVSLILKTLTNPYFVSMKQAAQAQATKRDKVARCAPVRRGPARSTDGADRVGAIMGYHRRCHHDGRLGSGCP